MLGLVMYRRACALLLLLLADDAAGTTGDGRRLGHAQTYTQSPSSMPRLVRAKAGLQLGIVRKDGKKTVIRTPKDGVKMQMVSASGASVGVETVSRPRADVQAALTHAQGRAQAQEQQSQKEQPQPAPQHQPGGHRHVELGATFSVANVQLLETRPSAEQWVHSDGFDVGVTAPAKPVRVIALHGSVR